MKPKEFRLDKAKRTPSVCPYCSVGCAIIIYTINGRIVNIEGDPQSPHSEGCLCPKGAATLQLHYNRNRASRVLHRKPGAKDWDEVTLDWAMNRVARVNHTTAIFALGGATLDNEWNHLQQKLMRGLGVVAVENQARI
jgi:formate dehydrogenase major subunit